MSSKIIFPHLACAFGLILSWTAAASAQTRVSIEELQKIYDAGNEIKSPKTPDIAKADKVTELMHIFVPGESAAVRHAVAYGLASVADTRWIPRVGLMRELQAVVHTALYPMEPRRAPESEPGTRRYLVILAGNLGAKALILTGKPPQTQKDAEN